MNVAVRTLTQVGVFPRFFTSPAILKNNVMVTILSVALLFSAFSVIYVKDMNRRLVGNLQTLQITNENLHNKWSQLLLEESAWTSSARVQQIASQRLGMVMPRTKSVVTVG